MTETYPPRACRKADHNRISDQRIILDSNRRENQRGGGGQSHRVDPILDYAIPRQLLSPNSFLFPVTAKTGGPNVFSKGIYKSTNYDHLDVSDMGKS